MFLSFFSGFLSSVSVLFFVLLWVWGFVLQGTALRGEGGDGESSSFFFFGEGRGKRVWGSSSLGEGRMRKGGDERVLPLVFFLLFFLVFPSPLVFSPLVLRSGCGCTFFSRGLPIFLFFAWFIFSACSHRGPRMRRPSVEDRPKGPGHVEWSLGRGRFFQGGSKTRELERYPPQTAPNPRRSRRVSHHSPRAQTCTFEGPGL